MKEIQLTKGYVTIVDDWVYNWACWVKWCIQNNSCLYAVTNLYRGNGKYILLRLHRLILGAKDGEFVDHIDGNTLNNLESNLRLCTSQENCMNQKPQIGRSSIYKGVGWRKERNKWRAYIKINRKQIILGCFNNEIEAAKAYDEAAIKYFGDFARLNFPNTK